MRPFSVPFAVPQNDKPGHKGHNEGTAMPFFPVKSRTYGNKKGAMCPLRVPFAPFLLFGFLDPFRLIVYRVDVREQ